MKKFILFTCLSCLFMTAHSQSGEFEIQENGLIYSETTMNNLKEIVDSLNLNFKSCDTQNTFHAKDQNMGHRIRITGKRARTAKAAIEKNTGFDDLLKEYPAAEVSRNNLIVVFPYENYKKEALLEYSQIEMGGDQGYRIYVDAHQEQYQPQNLSHWIYSYSEPTSYNEESITAFYFPKPFERKELPAKYTRLISYADCLIDTASTKYKEDRRSGWVDIPENWKSLNREEQKELLEELRSTRVIGTCSQDSRPREHAVNIAMLSAETKQWEVFLRAHLDVMNDRFERASDGSYAWGERKTYIKELEELRINVPDLILGIALRVEDPAKNHYYGSISRVGRALAETKNKKEVEHMLFSVVRDKELDLYNRVLGYFLIRNYIDHLTDNDEQIHLTVSLNKAIRTLPDTLSRKMHIE